MSETSADSGEIADIYTPGSEAERRRGGLVWSGQAGHARQFSASCLISFPTDPK